MAPVQQPVEPVEKTATPETEPSNPTKLEPIDEESCKTSPIDSTLEGIPKALQDLMIANHVTAQDIQEAVAYKKYFPVDMPVQDYPEDFVMGCLVSAFPQMLDVIHDLKKVPF